MAVRTHGPNSEGLILGERWAPPARRITPEVAAMDHVTAEAMVDEGEFVYGPVVKPKALKLPELNPSLPDRSNSVVPLTDFYERALDNCCISEAMDLFRGIRAFASRPDGVDTRPVLIDAPAAQWEAGQGIASLMQDVLDLYGVRTQEHRLRDDPGPQGTKVYLAFSGAPLLFVERSVIGRGNTLRRRLEAADASSKESITKVLNELSLGERIRVEALLDNRQATGAQKIYALERATRESVRSDTDVDNLLARRHAAEEPRWRRALFDLAARAINKLLEPPDWFLPSKSKISHRL